MKTDNRNRAPARGGADGEADFRASYDITKFPRPSVAADIVALTLREEPTGDWRAPVLRRASVLLVKRGGHPFRGMWALPGGFLCPGESLDECARRELFEETALEASSILPLAPVSTPGRDPRGWILSAPHLCIVSSGANAIRSGSDADDARWFPLDGLPPKLAFDHAAILAGALRRLRSDSAAHELAFSFLPAAFTLAELHDVVRGFGIADDAPANFRRKVLPLVEPAGGVRAGAGHRPAALYRRRPS